MRIHGGKTSGLVRGALLFSLFLCAFAFALFLSGALWGFADETLLLLLRVSRFFGFTSLGFSLCALVIGFQNRRVLASGLYLLSGIFGSAILFLNSFIIALAGGNV